MKFLHLVNIWKIKLTPASFYILSIQINLPFISSAYQCKQLFIKKTFYDENGEKISLTIFLHTFRATLLQRSLRRLHRVLLNVGARASVMFLQEMFSRSLKAIKRQRVRFGLSFTGVNIIKMTFVFKPRLHEGRRSPAIIWL